MQTKNDKIDIFWTGGLDSTFRLMQCLKTTESIIQPHYIVRYEDSTGIEIDTMIQIRRKIVRTFPEVRARFLPTIYVNEDLIPKFRNIEEEIEEFRKTYHVREQYQIMSYYCKAYNIDQIDVSLIKLSEVSEEDGFFEKFSSTDAFKYFNYPIINLTKKDLFKIAKKNGWDEILYMTSFCRRPIKKIKPCGLCGPCADAVSSEMSFRFPLTSYIKAKLQIPLRRYWRKNYLRQNETRLFRLIKRRFEGRL